MRKSILAGIALVLVSSFASGQDPVFPELDGFKKLTKYPVFLPENLYEFINGAADTYLALGFTDLHVAEYKKGKDIIKAEIYRHSSNTMAFGIYASERSPSYRFLNLGAQGYVVDGVVNFFKGNFYVKLRTYSEKQKTLQAQEALARRIEAMLQGPAEMPDMLSKFPDNGKKENEETFVNESVLGHQFLNKAFKANYRIGNDDVSIYLIRSGSADETLRVAKAYLSSAGIEFDINETRYVFTDGYNGNIFLAWSGDLMVIISGLAKDQADIAATYTYDILK